MSALMSYIEVSSFIVDLCYLGDGVYHLPLTQLVRDVPYHHHSVLSVIYQYTHISVGQEYFIRFILECDQSPTGPNIESFGRDELRFSCNSLGYI